MPSERTPSGVAVVIASEKLWSIGAVHAVIFAGNEFIRMIRAVSAGVHEVLADAAEHLLYDNNGR